MIQAFIKKNRFLLVAAPIFSFLLFALSFSSCGIYGFSQKGTVEDSARTVKVATFENKAPYVNPQVSPALSERLRQKIISQTKLANTNNENADYNITGYIADYSVTTTGVTSSNGQQQSSLNRLTVRVQVSLSKFGGQPEEFSVSRSFDFSAQQSLQAAEASLLEEMIRNLTDEFSTTFFPIGDVTCYSMSERMNALAQFLGKSSIEECTLDELQQLTSQYPYFAPAQFLLLQKLKDDGSADFDAQRQKAMLYYHDPLQFELFVSPEKFRFDRPVFTEKRVVDEPTTPSGTDVIHQAEGDWIDDPSEFENNLATEQVAEDLSLQDLTQTRNTVSSLDGFAHAEERNSAAESEEANFQDENLPEERTFASRQDEKPTEVIDSTDEIPAEGMLETREADLLPAAQTSQPITEAQAQMPVAEVDQTVPKSQVDAISNSVSESKTKAGEAALIFEPYYTVDYFASQGIRQSTEELPKDKLGRQLRSFTEWLKIMKRLPATAISKTPESPAEKTVESMASHSVADSDVVTEAMAEVWTKQGHPEKAIETYNKLSLLIPSKKAYFAAKIENLKQS